MAVAAQRQQVDQMYDEFRKIPLQSWIKAAPQQLATDLGKAGVDLNGKNAEKFGTAVRLFGRLAHEADREAFYIAVAEGEIPPLKLSAEEMEVVRGGIAATGSFLIGVGIGLVVGGIAYLAGKYL